VIVSRGTDGHSRRLERLIDLGKTEVIVVRCRCGSITEYGQGFLQRRHRVASDTLVHDLRYRLKCGKCNNRDQFKISIIDKRDLGDSSKPMPEWVIVDLEN
jgi:hypothetical protein